MSKLGITSLKITEKEIIMETNELGTLKIILSSSDVVKEEEDDDDDVLKDDDTSLKLAISMNKKK